MAAIRLLIPRPTVPAINNAMPKIANTISGRSSQNSWGAMTVIELVLYLGNQIRLAG